LTVDSSQLAADSRQQKFGRRVEPTLSPTVHLSWCCERNHNFARRHLAVAPKYG